MAPATSRRSLDVSTLSLEIQEGSILSCLSLAIAKKSAIHSISGNVPEKLPIRFYKIRGCESQPHILSKSYENDSKPRSFVKNFYGKKYHTFLWNAIIQVNFYNTQVIIGLF